MINDVKRQCDKLIINSLFKYSFANIAVQLFSGALLLFMSWQNVHSDALINAGLLITCSLLVSMLYQTKFLRKQNEAKFDHVKWESIYTINAVLISAIFAGSYVYLSLSSSISLYAVAFVLVMHTACLAMISVCSKKVLLGVTLPLTVPNIAAFLYLYIAQGNAAALPNAIALTLYTAVLLAIGFKLYASIRAHVQLIVQHGEQEELSARYLEKIKQTTIEDHETEVFNRRFFDLTINQEVRRAKRAGTSFSIIILKLDFYEECLAEHGPEKLSKCVQSIAKTLANATLRGGEYVTRFEDNQFAFTLPNVTSDHAYAFSSKLLDLIGASNIEHIFGINKDKSDLPISFGITEFKPGNIIDVDEIIEQASNALLQAKENKANPIFVFDASNAGAFLSASHSKPVLVSSKTDVA